MCWEQQVDFVIRQAGAWMGAGCCVVAVGTRRWSRMLQKSAIVGLFGVVKFTVRSVRCLVKNIIVTKYGKFKMSQTNARNQPVAEEEMGCVPPNLTGILFSLDTVQVFHILHV